MKTQDILPVVLSIVVIILVAIIEKQSKFIAAMTATMPLGAALALWIVYASASGDQATVTRFSFSLILGILPTVGFLVAAWLASRSGLSLLPILLIGYAIWGIGFGLLIALRKAFGLSILG
jgi:uncharacterized membrane protein (GlpM family)